ncbi:MAG TPA: hypothetical protein VLL52_00890 [Anaerolineae bacterium]|nr:hypothetical protein [Anaerolineae bacterium]
MIIINIFYGLIKRIFWAFVGLIIGLFCGVILGLTEGSNSALLEESSFRFLGGMIFNPIDSTLAGRFLGALVGVVVLGVVFGTGFFMYGWELGHPKNWLFED